MKIEVYKKAVLEIRNLRRDNQLLASRLKMFDDMMLLIKTIPIGGGNGSVCYQGPDIIEQLESYIREQQIMNDGAKVSGPPKPKPIYSEINDNDNDGDDDE